MGSENPKLQVSHVNVRLSISLLLGRLIIVEIVSAFLVLAFFISWNLYEQELLNFINFPLISLPLYAVAVMVKTFITIGIILQWLNEYYEITKTIVYHRKGLIFKTEERYFLRNVAQVEVIQGVLGRLFNFGTISLSDERRNKIIDMDYLHNPMRYAKILEDLSPQASEVKHILREHIVEKDIFD